MSLRSARPVDENLSELTEHTAPEEAPATQENGEETLSFGVTESVLENS